MKKIKDYSNWLWQLERVILLDLRASGKVRDRSKVMEEEKEGTLVKRQKNYVEAKG